MKRPFCRGITSQKPFCYWNSITLKLQEHRYNMKLGVGLVCIEMRNLQIGAKKTEKFLKFFQLKIFQKFLNYSETIISTNSKQIGWQNLLSSKRFLLEQKKLKSNILQVAESTNISMGKRWHSITSFNQLLERLFEQISVNYIIIPTATSKID